MAMNRTLMPSWTHKGCPGRMKRDTIKSTLHAKTVMTRNRLMSRMS